MTPLQLLLDGARAAAGMLALLVVAPAAATPSGAGAAAPPEHAVQGHRWTTGAGDPVDGMRAAGAGHAVALLAADDCAEPTRGHARLTVDEAIADAHRRPGSDDLLHAALAARPPASAGIVRVALPAPVMAGAPRALLIERDDAWLLAVVPHRRAAAATLVLRPVTGEARWVPLGAVDPRVALLIPLANRNELDDLDQGAIEVELASGTETVWSTIVAERVDERGVQAGAAD
jgi:hypothetical protein